MIGCFKNKKAGEKRALSFFLFFLPPLLADLCDRLWQGHLQAGVLAQLLNVLGVLHD